MRASLNPRDLARRKFQHVAAHVLDGHAAALKDHDTRLTELSDTVGHNVTAMQTFLARGVLGRLRWLLLGS